jgi:H+/Cl- antiporter ClcA
MDYSIFPAILPCGFMGLFGTIYLFVILFVTVVGFGVMGLWIWMLIDAARRDEKDFPDDMSNPKPIWLLIILLGQWVGALIYYIVIYRKDRAKKDETESQSGKEDSD